MKKQEYDSSSSSLAASSSQRANSPKNVRRVNTNIGCMSGIFRLLYTYSNRRAGAGKFITSGKKQEKNLVSSSLEVEEETITHANGVTRSSYNVPRSPTLPAEIRWSSTVNSPSTVLTVESASEKRRKLLEALEKCDEDLKALKKIIDVVKNSVNVADDDDDNYSNDNNNNNNTLKGNYFSERDKKCLSFKKNNNGGNYKCLEVNGELRPSPVSVLEDFVTPATLMSSYSRRYTNGRAIQQQMKQQKQKKKPGEDEEIISSIYFVDDKIRAATEYSNDDQAAAKRNGTDHHDQKLVTSPLWASKAMIESVNEVCRDIAWGEKREIGRIGLALQDRIYRDLIEEIVRELEWFPMFSLPFEACKRSLHF